MLGEGIIVEFDIGNSEKGTCAINVRPIDDRPQQTKGSVLLGAIKSRTNTYGFIKLDAGRDLFFHRDYCTPSTRFNKLEVGDRIRCTLEIGADGRRFGINVELYSGL